MLPRSSGIASPVEPSRPCSQPAPSPARRLKVRPPPASLLSWWLVAVATAVAACAGSSASEVTTAPSSSPPDETAPDADAPDAAAPDAAAPDTAAPDAAASEAKETQPRLLYGREIVQFAHVDKAGDYFRRMFIDAPSAQSFAATGTLPEGATLYLETWFGADQSTVYVRQKQGSGFVSGSFAPSLPSYELTTTASCDGCHATAQATESTYTLPLLRKALDRGLVQRIACDLTSFNPCDLSVYQGE